MPKIEFFRQYRFLDKSGEEQPQIRDAINDLVNTFYDALGLQIHLGDRVPVTQVVERVYDTRTYTFSRGLRNELKRAIRASERGEVGLANGLTRGEYLAVKSRLRL